MTAEQQAALDYASKARPIFPVGSNKKPLISKEEGGRGYLDATIDEATIRGWWERWPNAGIATPTGPDWFVLDVDDEEALDRLIAEHGPLPPTVGVVTPRPGRHVYLRGEVTNSNGALPKGIHVRGQGGYVLLPPSPHENGVYQWRTAPDEVPIAPAPEWLMGLLSPPASGAAPPVEGPIPDHRRNTTLTSLAGTMRRRGLHEDAIAAALLATNADRCVPPLSEAEVRKIAHSVSRYEHEGVIEAEDVAAEQFAIGQRGGADNGSEPEAVNIPALMLAQSRVDLIEMIENGIPERQFVPGTGGALVKGKRHHIAASAKTGKSLAIGIVLAVDVVFAGGAVVVLDRENGSDEYARRLGSVLDARKATKEQRELVRANYRYHVWPVLKLEWGTEPDYPAAFSGADLVIFDSTRKFLTSVGLEENVSDDYSKFAELLVDPLTHAEIASMLLDNAGHEENRARGSSSKGDLCDVMFTLQATRSSPSTGPVAWR